MKLSNINENKKYIIIIISLLFICAIGFTFAFFQPQSEEEKKLNVSAKSHSLDDLSFEIGEDITLNPNQFNFGEGQGDVSGETTAKAVLQANNKTNLASVIYNTFFIVDKNEFSYSTSEKLPELVLYIEGPDGVVTSIDGFGNAIDVTDSSGNSFKAFDITEFNGVINITNNKTIEVTSSDNGKKEENWKIKVIFLNLDADQTHNSEKNFDGKIFLSTGEYADSVKDVIASGEDLSSGVEKLYEKGNSIFTNLYYHDGSLARGIDDNSYRFAGSDPNNYVCFGSDEATCPTDSLYRIIGLFDGKIKLVKADYAKKELLGTDGDFKEIYNDYFYNYYKGDLSKNDLATYYWNYNNDPTTYKSGDNTWSTSLLNKTNLNTNFLNNIGTKWENMINDTLWIIPSNNWSNVSYATPAFSYQWEVGQYASNVTYYAKIGLLYATDYGFAADPSAWSTRLYDYNVSLASDNNWLYHGLSEWLLSPSIDYDNSILHINYQGNVLISYGYRAGCIRPVFYLKDNVKFVSGKGTKSDPIRVSL